MRGLAAAFQPNPCHDLYEKPRMTAYSPKGRGELRFLFIYWNARPQMALYRQAWSTGPYRGMLKAGMRAGLRGPLLKQGALPVMKNKSQIVDLE